MMRAFYSNSVKESLRFGSRLARFLAPGSVVGFQGDLGSGKTTLIQGIAEGLGIPKQDVKSPTFVIFHVYNGEFPVYHFDLYRLEEAKELSSIGFEEFTSDPKAVSLVEWIEKAGLLQPEDLLIIHLRTVSPTQREFKLEARGLKAKKILQEFTKK